MTRRGVRYVVLAGLVTVVTITVLIVSLLQASLSRPHAGWDGEFVDVELEPGVDAGTVLLRLRDAGVIEHRLPLRLWLAWKGGSGGLHAGEYRFDEPASPLEVLARLQAGDVLLHPITIPEGLTLAEIASRLAAAELGREEDFLASFGSGEPVHDIDAAAIDLEGYLFPDTYHFPRETTVERITTVMVQRFKEIAGDDYSAAAQDVGLTLREAVTLASLVEKETSVPEERGRISRVFHNRLRRRMLLQCDPTVVYALAREGVSVERLTYKHLEFESPWNTYVSPGLPPGPIANPGQGSLQAAVHPDAGDELYFVAAPGGGHRFSSNLEAHLEAVREWRSYSRSSR
jgi:UPF0755 protein